VRKGESQGGSGEGTLYLSDLVKDVSYCQLCDSPGGVRLPTARHAVRKEGSCTHAQ